MRAVQVASLSTLQAHLNQAEEGDIKMSIAAELGYPDKDDHNFASLLPSM